NTINEKVTIIVFQGSEKGHNGKATLAQIMFEISKCNYECLRMEGNVYPRNICCLHNVIFMFDEMESLDNLTYMNQVIRGLPFKTGTGIYLTNKEMTIKDYNNSSKRKVLYLHFPNVFKNDLSMDSI